MPNDKPNNPAPALIDELRAAGAQPDEARQLAAFASGLRSLRQIAPARTAVSVTEITIRRSPQPVAFGWWYRLVSVPALILALVLVGGVTFAFAARSLPGDWLYPAKQAVEHVVAQILPDQEAAIALRQSEDIKQSLEKRAKPAPAAIKPALKDIERAASRGRLSKEAAGQQVIEHNLQDAQHRATGSTRSAIDQTLQAVKDSQERASSTSTGTMLPTSPVSSPSLESSGSVSSDQQGHRTGANLATPPTDKSGNHPADQ